ncbi:PD-(D/E)XK nuclease-like domain-containing protein [Micromonospora sp. NPDC001898]|uniref:PD-(D/E)XK nuclease-like domain-containing protein n=1 Tax=Micromonospora sp. NPDC001898 TaxID=3364221 RepID=UPI0036885F30
MTTTTPLVVTEPGIHPDMSESAYHRDPVPAGSLSSTGARKLLPPSCPAKFRHWLDHPDPPKDAFDLGHAAHLKVLGRGLNLAVVDAADWRTKAAKEAKAAAYAAGQVPLLIADHQRVENMAAAIRRHPIAGPLLAPDSGQPEVSVFWIDPATGMWCRARYDFLRHPVPGRRRIVVDYKTTPDASLEHIQRAIHRFGYHQQGGHYLDGAVHLGLADDPAFVLVFQETEPPHLITVVQPDPVALRIGRDLNRQALEVYAECTRTGLWPDHSDDIEPVALPAWVERQHTKEIW